MAIFGVDAESEESEGARLCIDVRKHAVTVKCGRLGISMLAPPMEKD